MASEWGKARLGILNGHRGMGGRGVSRPVVSLLGFVFEVCEYGIKNAVDREGMVVIKVTVCGCLSVYVKSFYCVQVDAFPLEV